ncbi:RNA polymerase sigma factor, sigma-70 family [Pseudarcicella hirudinis]|uniref:RNA polymerase sigma factor, sigma-70 family n=1 Tax=Pseudarcicella hirudinis TaxID=1079859 RepID=A0A1I5TV03_9BACT|nr:sigma-70 family RNA polymerase sigma factor [Pseudarcicella hirudinis]SFP86895.1 RNA polymerase sigma factor, sigma-70 family [Pseudarcicella hirudinis]
MNTSLTDTELWKAFKTGDNIAFQEIYERYFKVLSSYGYRLTKDKLLLEDAIHDLFLELWRRRDYLTEVDNIKFYLFRALRNQMSRSAKKDLFEDSEDINDFLDHLVTISSEQESINQESGDLQTTKVLKALDNLSRRQREVIHLRFYHGLSLDEIAQITGLTKQVISNLQYKSYAVLRLTLKALASFFLFLSDYVLIMR